MTSLSDSSTLKSLEELALKCPPRIRNVAVGASIEEARICLELANAYCGVVLLDWQEDIILCWLAKRDDGLYAHSMCCLQVPRQNGKSKAILVARILIGLIIYGETIRFSSHIVDTMTDVFDIVMEIFGDTRNNNTDFPYPELAKLVKRRNYANGHLKLEMKNGGSCSFVARSKGNTRGKTVDVNIIDEAQYLTFRQQADIAPSQSAAKLGNPQTIYAFTPPDYEDAPGEVISEIRRSVIKSPRPSTCWHEWGVEEIGDIYDKTRWYATNPMLGFTLSARYIEEQELYSMGEEKFARERLGWWAGKATEDAISKSGWLDTRIASVKEIPTDFDKMCVGVKFAPGGSAVAITTATLAGDEAYGALIKYETKETATGIEWLVNDIYRQKDKVALVAIDGKSGAEDLKNRLIKRGMSKKALTVMTTAEVVAAATMLNSYIDENKFKHVEDPCLDKSAMTSKKRKIGQDGYGFGGGEELPVEAMAAAHWAVRTTKRNPGRPKGFSHG
ncbi:MULTISPECIES: hypothetical protein [unclassified Adlercreutzia]|uniref:hypothetical protein n=1 Tax=unclassified Adlercreutzia TaxID=2636013 RepID=UPI0013ED01AE|nr:MULTISPECIES: hypothetical protein [unclassified Adlercreutzia]